MKKLIITIITFMPFFLILAISSIGRLVGNFTHIPVENVFFIYQDGKIVQPDESIEIDVGEEYQINIKINPELASNKKVRYLSTNTEICTIDSQGVILGVSYGSSTIFVTTEDGKKTNSAKIFVSRTGIEEVNIVEDDFEMFVGGTRQISFEVAPYTAIDKSVKFSSSDLSVATIGVNGTIRALKEGVTTITARSNSNPNISDSIVVTVLDNAPIAFNTELENLDIGEQSYISYSDEVDLTTLYKVADYIIEEYPDYYVKCVVTSYPDRVQITDNILVFLVTGKSVNITFELYSNISGTKLGDTLTLRITRLIGS